MCIKSVLDQTYKDFYIYEINYGTDDFNFSDYFSKFGRKYKFFKKELKNHAEAMNYLLDKCLKDKMDVVFNTNMDDYYNSYRFEKQLEKIKEGYDIVSSDIQYVMNDKLLNIFKFSDFNSDINGRIDYENIIAHPTVCYSKKFLENIRYIPEEIPSEDYNLWKRLLKNDYKFYIVDSILCYYRIHENQVSKDRDIKKIENNNINNQLDYIRNATKDRCRCGGQIVEIVYKSGNKYRMCDSCKIIY